MESRRIFNVICIICMCLFIYKVMLITSNTQKIILINNQMHKELLSMQLAAITDINVVEELNQRIKEFGLKYAVTFSKTYLDNEILLVVHKSALFKDKILITLLEHTLLMRGATIMLENPEVSHAFITELKSWNIFYNVSHHV